MSGKLAINGGKPVRKKEWPPYPIIMKQDIDAVTKVLKSGELSTFHSSFRGGIKVNEFEKKFAKYHGVEYGIAVNSGTAALHIALAAAGVQPGDEVVIPAYTFTATATSVLMHNAIPVFADVDPKTFNVTAKTIEKAITKYTKAIIPVHLLGNPAPMNSIMKLAKKKKLVVIEDCAQAPGAMLGKKRIGTFGDMSCFSFQEVKNIMTGEGGMVLSDNEYFAYRCQLVRNHGEAFMDRSKPRSYLSNILGWNYRMTEMEAAFGVSQFKRFDKYNNLRIKNSEYLNKKLSNYSWFTPQKTEHNAKHIYSLFGFTINPKKLGINNHKFAEALSAEGIPFGYGYPRPLYMNPLFQKRVVYGDNGCPFTCKHYKGKVSYEQGLCPNAEYLCDYATVWTGMNRPPATKKDMDDILNAIEKICNNIDELKEK